MHRFCVIGLGLLWVSVRVVGQADAGSKIVQPVLTAEGGTPFYLQAVITERGDPNERVDIEMSWIAPNRWKRTIRSQEFSQTLIVNGEKVFEQDSDDYFPLGIHVLAGAMVDPRPVLAAVRPGDPARTKANGRSDESGRVCFSANGKMCLVNRNGLTEFVGGPGRSVEFADYQKFKRKRVARTLTYHIDPGDSLQARVMTLGELDSRNEGEFAVPNPTPKDKQIQSVVVSEPELREMALQPIEIVWPQVLDGNTSGTTSYYLSVDRTGRVREAFPLSVAVERADDSARRQMLRWRFKPVVSDGVAVQAESVFNFHFDTRAFGPSVPLENDEVRKLASNMTEPVFPPAAVSGTSYSLWVAVDSDGQVIETIAGDGPRELSDACHKAIAGWRFSPIMDEGKPRPYRARVTFKVP